MSHSCEVCGDTQKQLRVKHISLLRHKTMKNHDYAFICTECFNLLNDKPSINHYEHLGDEHIEHCNKKGLLKTGGGKSTCFAFIISYFLFNNLYD